MMTQSVTLVVVETLIVTPHRLSLHPSVQLHNHYHALHISMSKRKKILHVNEARDLIKSLPKEEQKTYKRTVTTSEIGRGKGD